MVSNRRTDTNIRLINQKQINDCFKKNRFDGNVKCCHPPVSHNMSWNVIYNLDRIAKSKIQIGMDKGNGQVGSRDCFFQRYGNNLPMTSLQHKNVRVSVFQQGSSGLSARRPLYLGNVNFPDIVLSDDNYCTCEFYSIETSEFIIDIFFKWYVTLAIVFCLFVVNDATILLVCYWTITEHLSKFVEDLLNQFTLVVLECCGMYILNIDGIRHKEFRHKGASHIVD